MTIKLLTVVPCALLTLVACDVAESDLEARSAEVDGSRASSAVSAPTDDLISQNYCDHADRVFRAEASRSHLEADGDLARDRERVLLDDLRAGEAVFADAEQLVLRGAEVHVGYENGWLVAAQPGADAPLAKLRLANGVKVHIFADDVRKLVVSKSIASADIGHLLIMTALDGAVDVDIEAPPTCLVIDGGGDAAAGPLQVDANSLNLTAGPKPTKATIHGTAGPDDYTGTEGVDYMYGYGGNDRLDGRGSGDRLYGNTGFDRVYGGGSPLNNLDELYGGKDDDHLDGPNAVCFGDDGYDHCGWCNYYYDCNFCQYLTDYTCPPGQ